MGNSTDKIRSRPRLERLLLALAVCLLGIAARIPFRSQVLHHWDSVNFALALEHYDVRLHQPHPPGTFIIYILLGRLLNNLLHDPNASLVWLSVLSSGLGSAALFLLSEEWFGRRVALITVLLAITSPLIWFHGEVALSYMLEYLWVPLVVYFCYQMQTRHWYALLVSALLIGLAGGVRPNTPVFLFPLWAAGAVMHRYSVGKILLALGVMTVGVLIWAIPMVVMSGGLQEYIEVMRWWQGQHVEESASLEGIATNLARFGVYLFYTLGAGLIPLTIAACRNLRGIIRSLRGDWRAQALAVWTLPATGYFLLIHLRQPGHTFTILPACLILTGLALSSLIRANGENYRRAWAAVSAFVVIANALFFLVGPAHLCGDTRMLFTTPFWNAIQEYDTYVSERLDAIRQNFSPQETTVLASGRNFRLPDFYLSDFQLPSLSHEVNAGPIELKPPIRFLVFFDDLDGLAIPADLPIRCVPLQDGKCLQYMTWDDRMEVVVLRPDALEVRER